MNKTNLLILSIFTIFLSACNTNINEDNNLSTINQTETHNKKNLSPIQNEEKENNLLKELGFEIKDEKIIIDMNKTNNFFEQLNSQMEQKSKEIGEKLERAELNLTEESIGIIIEGDQIGIDLNKTKNMIKGINILIKEILLDVNSSHR